MSAIQNNLPRVAQIINIRAQLGVQVNITPKYFSGYAGYLRCHAYYCPFKKRSHCYHHLKEYLAVSCKVKLVSTQDPEIPFLGNYLKEIKTFVHTKTDIRISIDASPGAPG